MKRSDEVIFFLNSFATGLIAPVLTLVFLNHGAVLTTLSLFVAIFSGTIFIFEVPSGIVSDCFGRKFSFLLSHLSLTANYGLLIVSDSAGILAVCCILFGLGKAFASGSLEALAVEQYRDEKGLVEINSRILFVESLGLATGSLAGGVLGAADSNYRLLLSVILAVEVTIIILTLVFVIETRTLHQSNAGMIQTQVTGMANAIRTSGLLPMVMLLAAVTGGIQAVFETYWQQNFINLVPEGFLSVIGVVGCLGYAGVMAGTRAVERVLAKNQKRLTAFYFTLKLLAAVAIMLLGLCGGWFAFVIVYFLCYVFLGGGEVSEATMLHSEVSDEYRASILSVYSFVIRAGGLLSALASSLIISRLGVTTVWVLIPVFAVAVTVVVRIWFTGKYKMG